MNVFVVFYQGLDGFGGQLEGDFILRDHVDVDDVCFDREDLVVEQSFDQRVVVLSELRLGRLG